MSELAAMLALPETAIGAALDALLDAGLLRESREHVGQLRAVDPEVGLELLLRRQEADLAREQQELAMRREAAARAVAELAALRPKDGKDTTRQLVGVDAIQAQIEILAKNVATEIHTVTAGAALSAEMLEAARPMDEDVLVRGVAVHVLYQSSVRNDPATHAHARWLTDLGGQVRTAPLLPPPMLVYDRSAAIVLIDPAERGRGALCTREPGMVGYLLALFQKTWDSAVPLGADVSEDPSTGLSPSERELLKLLAGGMTDERAAARLGVSHSTVRRQMGALMERLGATSRFEAGLRAAQRGWI
ncbi:helix-turn-helix transcriptional regulator [Actinospica durhamensis]|uniref:Helix-turn-helix transcriptional regulator n=1 Tax=Actinospica durhamensis TaxID=1508375 RepID=A0A941EN43_9ACTN|nr:helix-turn-helix transcriptional regulator [Actinospica durhamensis]MBR7834737.1 helix-turn-helix transcriptional regulator [Actinospica durhamensis]